MHTTAQKLTILADAAKYDASCASSGGKRAGSKTGIGSVTGEGICHSYTPDGRCVSLLKVLLTNYCIFDCRFCVNRISSDVARARFEPKELAQLFIDFYKRNYVEGLFLSSGIIRNADFTMEQMIRVVQILRDEHGFAGYVHLKAVPGASPELIARAGRVADRMSVNIELPTDEDLRKLAPEKCVAVIENAMTGIASGIETASDRGAPKFAPAGQSTQMVIGASETSDRTILDTSTRLYDRYKLRRIYYSAYSPTPAADVRLPAKAPPLVREHRLYEADWLVRNYEFTAEELTTSAEPNLSLERDPKLSWAMRQRSFFPVDVNTAERFQLLRIPGFGTRNVDRILSLRKHHRIGLADLSKLRVVLDRARPFIIAADHRPRDLLVVPAPKAQQLSLFPTSLSGQL